MRVLWLCAFLVGCPGPKKGKDPGPCGPDGTPPTLSLGTGEGAFQSLEEVGHELTLVHGPQGGYHLVIRLQATHLDTHLGQVAATFRGFVNGRLLAEVEPWVTMDCADEVLTAEPIFLIYDGTPDTLDLQETRIEVEVRDNDGTTVSTSTEVLIVDQG